MTGAFFKRMEALQIRINSWTRNTRRKLNRLVNGVPKSNEKPINIAKPSCNRVCRSVASMCYSLFTCVHCSGKSINGAQVRYDKFYINNLKSNLARLASRVKSTLFCYFLDFLARVLETDYVENS